MKQIDKDIKAGTGTDINVSNTQIRQAIMIKHGLFYALFTLACTLRSTLSIKTFGLSRLAGLASE